MRGIPANRWLRRLTGRPAMQDWLTERGSLTARLRACCQTFELRCLTQRLEVLDADEAARLGVRPGSLAWVREVLLLTDGVPVIFAHTVMARRPRHPFDLRFGALGERSLGSLLFSDPGIARGPLEFRCLDQRHPLHRRAEAILGPLPARLWARRSHFGRQAKGVLVTELFLPPVLDLEHRIRTA
ncbi:chorismate lyase [Azovibrio restrictus]|uniref:chorismate--pyruvate lyase family protein n=1 Tax=Azovibrio restrictus TaxID=146938 RepID=UPI0026F125C6|nr:chorismate lyase [Azovibrio restrictus]